MELSAVNRTSISNPLPKAKRPMQKTGRKLLRATGREDRCESVSPGFDTALMNSQQPCLPAQDLHKIKQDNIPEWKGRDSRVSTRSWGAVDG